MPAATSSPRPPRRSTICSSCTECSGDWHLALAAYNWGENQVARAIAINRGKGSCYRYASLVLPAETRQYVPKLMAVKRMITGEAMLRVALPVVRNRAYFTTVPRSASIDLAHAARFAAMEPAEFRALNAAYNPSIINASASMPLVVPADRAPGFLERLDEFLEREEGRRKLQSTKPAQATPVKVRAARRM